MKQLSSKQDVLDWIDLEESEIRDLRAASDGGVPKRGRPSKGSVATAPPSVVGRPKGSATGGSKSKDTEPTAPPSVEGGPEGPGSIAPR